MSQTGVTATTVKNLILDAGAIYANYGVTASERLIGATTGGNKFTVEREYRDIEVDGVKGPVKGLKRIISETAKLEVNLKEMSKENLLMALPGTAAADTDVKGATGTTHNSITSTGAIKDTDYLDNVAIVATVSGTNDPVVILVKNALADGGLEMELKDKDEAVIALSFAAHYDPADLAKVPYEIRYPKVTA